jgi:hypothetical protein
MPSRPTGAIQMERSSGWCFFGDRLVIEVRQDRRPHFQHRIRNLSRSKARCLPLDNQTTMSEKYSAKWPE